jgi:hypothetical protein
MEAALGGRPVRSASFVVRDEKLLACLISFGLLMLVHQSRRVFDFPYDSAEYWALARPQVLLHWASSRGYFYPTLLMPLRYVCDHVTDPILAFRLGNSLAYGIALSLLVPAFFQRAFGGKVTLLRRLVPVVLLGTLFPGVLIYPLSDLPALMFALGALYLALRGLEATSRAQMMGYMFAAGFLIAAAYNTRTIYMFAMAGLIVLVAVARPTSGLMPRWISVAAVLAGIVAVSAPQVAVNQMTHGVATPAVRAVQGDRSLFASQLVWGITLQRYETTIAQDAPQPTVFYRDPVGEQLFQEVAGGGDLFSLGYYAQVVLSHPVDFLALYGRHMINGLDVRDGMVYVRKPSTLRTLA